MSWSEVDLAYAAGILDGEGTIGVRRRKNAQGREYVDSMVSEETRAARDAIVVELHALNRRGKAV